MKHIVWIFLITAASIAFLMQKKNLQVPLSEQITVICTTNPIPSIPSTRILEYSMKSLDLRADLRSCKKIIVFDGVQPGYVERRKDYEKYKENVATLCAASPFFHNTELIFCADWVHLAGAIRTALEKVDTPYVFIHQHDFELAKRIDLKGLIQTMENHPEIKHVRLNAYKRNQPRKAWGSHHSYDGKVVKAFEKHAKVPLCKTYGWSDNDHIARVDYYRDFVLPRCSFGAMEWFLHPAFKQEFELRGESAHEAFGTYLYGDLDDGHYLLHLDGREAYEKKKAHF